ncbi:P-loop containing nucleoside triphosphate hydrolase protein [Martensiomyces pterosporus]|nr:P-loop containing nucleoside triphosphate hydrolase protein [Martensiomyces pterosporus]
MSGNTNASEQPEGASPILSWSNLNYDVKTKQHGVRRILHDISGQVYPGELVAIMGSSGAGKTTLLNVLAGRVQGGRLYGDIKFNGMPRNPHTFKRMLAFVEQDDLMFASLTVEETLLASAHLRLSNEKYTEEEKRERVSTVLRQLRLTHVKDTKIGGYGERGVSGGERKRASIGTELVTDPSILVLDEPSSGLDSSSAEMVVTLTREMSRQRNLCTMMTIHQPSAEMVAKFDKLILLSQGKLVYMGPAAQALPYFEHLGYPSTNPNPANFFIDLMTIDFSSDQMMCESEKRVQTLVDSFVGFRASGGRLPKRTQLVTSESFASAATTGSVEPGAMASLEKGNLAEIASRSQSYVATQDITAEEANLVIYEAPPLNSWLSEVLVLLKRDWLLCTRNKALLFGLLAQCLVTMIFLGFVFFQLGNTQSSVQNRIGALFSLTVQCTFPVIIPVMTVIMQGRAILLRERSGGTYRMTSYFVSKSLSFFPLVFCPFYVMYTGIYFIAHFQYDVAKFFIGLANISAILLAALGFAFAMSMLVRNLEVAHIIAPVTLGTLMLFAGNLSNAYAITPVLRWIKYLCIYYYAYSGFVQNEFGGLRFSCDEKSAICYHRGEDVIATYGLNQQTISECIVLNLVLAVGFYAIAYCLLRWLAKPRYLWI